MQKRLLSDVGSEAQGSKGRREEQHAKGGASAQGTHRGSHGRGRRYNQQPPDVIPNPLEGCFNDEEVYDDVMEGPPIQESPVTSRYWRTGKRKGGGQQGGWSG